MSGLRLLEAGGFEGWVIGVGVTAQEDASATSFEISAFEGSKSRFPRPFKLRYSQRRLFKSTTVTGCIPKEPLFQMTLTTMRLIIYIIAGFCTHNSQLYTYLSFRILPYAFTILYFNYDG